MVDGGGLRLGHGSVRPIIHYVPGAGIFPILQAWDGDEVLFVDSPGSIWGSSNSEGLFRIAYPERAIAGEQIHLEKFTSGDGLTSDHIGRIIQDREENIWVTTPKGVDRFRQSNVVTVKVPK
jgi:ligand-binding sensor domain-containing protein